MQILSLWFKVTAFLALIGVLAHCAGASRDLAPWVQGFFQARDVIDTVEAARQQPDPDEGSKPAAAPAPAPKPVYKFNE